jgi:hypothetical protein
MCGYCYNYYKPVCDAFVRESSFSLSHSRFPDARHSVLDKMDATMSAPREGIKEHGPVYCKL